MIFFKAEANSSIGGGHLHRCISIANECIEQGLQVAFIFSDSASESIQKVKQLGFQSFEIPFETQLDFESYKDFVPSGSLILFDTDNFHFYSGNLINKLHLQNIKTACYTITDQHRITTDIIINSNIISKTHTYNSPKETIKLLGPEYLIFSPSFRSNTIVERTIHCFENLLLFFGNADSHNLTSYFLDVIHKSQKNFKKIIVVVGPLNKHKEGIENKISNYSNLNIEYHYNTSQISKLYERTDIAITAAGMTMWEMALYKIPQLVVASSEREIKYSKYLKTLRFIEYLGEFNNLQLTPKSQAIIIDDILDSNPFKTLALTDFKNAINPNGITKMVSTFSKLVKN
tara:strand:- start:15376 stop:16410 length:1035 start_codon:yes stop_codon:yes gene_type:complete